MAASAAWAQYDRFYYEDCEDGDGVRVKGYDGAAGSEVDLVFPDYVDENPVREIGEDVFFGLCFQSVTLPSTLKVIGNRAFMSGSIPTPINIPASVTFIGEDAFAGCRRKKCNIITHFGNKDIKIW